jgi:amino acid adenylation domain-containing protein
VKKNLLQSKLEETFSTFKQNTALECGDRTVTYENLEKWSNLIAWEILKRNGTKETFVGILAGDRIDLVLSMVGIVKAGGVFIPLDVSYPENRLEVMIDITDLEIIIGDRDSCSRFFSSDAVKRNKVEFIFIDDLDLADETGVPAEMYEKPAVSYLPEDKVYIYFTSGTTGVPKAIVGKNEGLLQFINWEIKTFGIDDTFRFSQLTNPGFDVVLRDIFVPLCSGAAICIPENRESMMEPESIVRWIDEQGIHLMHCVPSLFRVFNSPALEPANFKQLKYVLFAGEKVIPGEMRNWYGIFGDRIQLVNLYGPTETTLAKMFYLIRPDDVDREIMPVGKHIDGCRVIILNEQLEVCERLAAGEIYIRTPYRSHGYLNDPGMNAEKFIVNPFNDDPDDVLYKTGDLGRLLPDGNIELLGRVDRQVKIRGMRVELDEIENTMLKYTSLGEAVVIKKELGVQNQLLSAAVTLKDRGTVDEARELANLRLFLSEKLPDYMIPGFILPVEKIPRVPNGKVDYKKVAEMMDNAQLEYIAPENDVERKLRDIWDEIFGHRVKIGKTNSFFELGGNSLNVMTLISKIHKVFDKRLSLEEIFNNLTIEKQAVLVGGAQEEVYTGVEPVEMKDYYELSSAQHRVYLLHMQQEVEKRTIYSIPQVVVIEEAVDFQRLGDVFRQLIRRHESLRTWFDVFDGRLVQRICQEVEFDIQLFEPLADQPGVTIADVIQLFVRPFELSRAPLFRAGLLELGKEKYLLMVDMHHIISDGISHDILEQDFLTLHRSGELPPLKLHYKDYSSWQNSEEIKRKVKKQETFWLEEFEGEIPVLNLPIDYPRPALHGVEGDKVNFAVSVEETQGLIALANDIDGTLFMVLLALYNVLLAKLSRQEDIVVGTVVTGRNHVDLERVIGMFVNNLALRNYPAGKKPFDQFLQEVKAKTLAVFENREYQFENLVDKVVKERDLARFPLYDAGFVFHNFADQAYNRQDTDSGAGSLRLSGYDYQKMDAIAEDIYLEGYLEGKQLRFIFRYSIELFKKETIEQFIKYFKEIIFNITREPGKKIEEISIISEVEAEKIRSSIQRSRDALEAEFEI